MYSNKNVPSPDVTVLEVRIKELEKALKESEEREKIKSGVCSDILLKYNSLAAEANRQINTLKERITELETGKGKYHSGLEWLGKIVFILRRTGRPLKAKELFEEINKIDPELRKRANPSNFLSAVLSEGVKNGRLILHKVKGTRGGYYALEGWTDEDGDLDIDMKIELI